MPEPDGEVTRTLRPNPTFSGLYKVLRDEISNPEANVESVGQKISDGVRQTNTILMDAEREGWRIDTKTGEVFRETEEIPLIPQEEWADPNVPEVDPYRDPETVRDVDEGLSQIYRDNRAFTQLQGTYLANIKNNFYQTGGAAGAEYMASQRSVSKQLNQQWDDYVDRITDIQRVRENQQEQNQLMRESLLNLSGPSGIGISDAGFSGPTGFENRLRQLASQQGFGQVGEGRLAPLSSGLGGGGGFAPEQPYRSITGNPLSPDPPQAFPQMDPGAFLGQIQGLTASPRFQGGTDENLPEDIDPQVRDRIGRPSIHLPTFIEMLKQTGRWIG